jgi:hypothetical protein
MEYLRFITKEEYLDKGCPDGYTLVYTPVGFFIAPKDAPVWRVLVPQKDMPRFLGKRGAQVKFLERLYSKKIEAIAI